MTSQVFNYTQENVSSLLIGRINKEKLFVSLFQSYVKANPRKSKQECQKTVVELWKKMKQEGDLPSQVDALLKKFESIAMRNKGALLSFWSKQSLNTDGVAHPPFPKDPQQICPR